MTTNEWPHAADSPARSRSSSGSRRRATSPGRWRTSRRRWRRTPTPPSDWDLASHETLQGVFEQYMPNWKPPARSYFTGILSNETSALIRMVDTPELFGGELRILAAVDLADGKIVRWVDYWDASAVRRRSLPPAAHARGAVPHRPEGRGRADAGRGRVGAGGDRAAIRAGGRRCGRDLAAPAPRRRARRHGTAHTRRRAHRSREVPRPGCSPTSPTAAGARSAMWSGGAGAAGSSGRPVPGWPGSPHSSSTTTDSSRGSRRSTTRGSSPTSKRPRCTSPRSAADGRGPRSGGTPREEPVESEPDRFSVCSNLLVVSR